MHRVLATLCSLGQICSMTFGRVCFHPSLIPAPSGQPPSASIQHRKADSAASEPRRYPPHLRPGQPTAASGNDLPPYEKEIFGASIGISIGTPSAPPTLK